jgi:hypothetical protein
MAAEAWRLREATASVPADGLTLADMLANVPGRQLGWLALSCALPSAVPGLQLGWVCGPLLLVIAAAAWRGRAHVAIPQRLVRRPVSQQAASRLLGAMAWTAERLERHCRPCWPRLAKTATGRPAATLMAGMALLILLPLLGSNFLPSLAIVALVAAMLRHDGRAMALAWALGGAGVAVTVGAAWLVGSALGGLA